MGLLQDQATLGCERLEGEAPVPGTYAVLHLEPGLGMCRVCAVLASDLRASGPKCLHNSVSG